MAGLIRITSTPTRESQIKTEWDPVPRMDAFPLQMYRVIDLHIRVSTRPQINSLLGSSNKIDRPCPNTVLSSPFHTVSETSILLSDLMSAWRLSPLIFPMYLSLTPSISTPFDLFLVEYKTFVRRLTTAKIPLQMFFESPCTSYRRSTVFPESLKVVDPTITFGAKRQIARPRISPPYTPLPKFRRPRPSRLSP